MFLLATTTSAYSAFAGPGVSSDTCTRVCYITCRLLQHLTGRCTKAVRRLTCFKECSTLLPAFLPVARSSTGVCRGCCTPSCTGSTYLSESLTNSESSCSAASIVERHSIWSITVYRSPLWRHGSTSVQPCSRRLLVVQRHRLRTYGRWAFALAGPTVWNSFPDNLRDRTLLQTTSSACWKRFCSQRTSAISALDVLRRCALQIYILLTHSLTYLLNTHIRCVTQKAQ